METKEYNHAFKLEVTVNRENEGMIEYKLGVKTFKLFHIKKGQSALYCNINGKIADFENDNQREIETLAINKIVDVLQSELLTLGITIL